jgi:MFS-type transporter involved in bile tolerance (Atg22 family)
VVLTWSKEEGDESPNEQISGSFTWVAMQTLCTLFIIEPKSFYIYMYNFYFIFPHGNKQVINICNDSVNAKHGFHHLKCDLY